MKYKEEDKKYNVWCVHNTIDNTFLSGNVWVDIKQKAAWFNFKTASKKMKDMNLPNLEVKYYYDV